jgi:heme exporter protein A
MTAQAAFAAAHITCFRQNRPLFSDLSFNLYPQQILIVDGPNGAGKSSLLRILSGLSTPCSGSIYWQGELIEKKPDQFHQALHYLGHSNGIKLG